MKKYSTHILVFASVNQERVHLVYFSNISHIFLKFLLNLLIFLKFSSHYNEVSLYEKWLPSFTELLLLQKTFWYIFDRNVKEFLRTVSCTTDMSVLRPVHTCKLNHLWMARVPNARTCAAPSAYSSCTIPHEPKFVGFLRKNKGSCVCRVDRAPITTHRQGWQRRMT